jgi:hypothetical protein
MTNLFTYFSWRGPTAVVHRNESVLKSIFKMGYEEIRDNFLFWNDVSFVPVRVLHKDEKILGRKHIYLPHAQTAIYDSKVKFSSQMLGYQLENKILVNKSYKYQGFQSGPVPGTFTCLRSCIVPAEITEPPKISGGQNCKYDRLVEYFYRSFFILKWCQLCSGLSFTQRWKNIGAKPYLFTACTNCYLRF